MDQPRGMWIFRNRQKFDHMRVLYGAHKRFGSEAESGSFFENAEFVLADQYFRNDPRFNKEIII